jgi:hypothetical protein
VYNPIIAPANRPVICVDVQVQAEVSDLLIEQLAEIEALVLAEAN